MGFLDDPKALEALQQLHLGQPDTWLGKLIELSRHRWDRNKWAKHWYRQFLSGGDDVTTWASFRLFLKCVDRRFWLWQEDLETEVYAGHPDVERPLFIDDNLDNLRKSIRDNEKDIAEQFLGQKILRDQVWPWMQLS